LVLPRIAAAELVMSERRHGAEPPSSSSCSRGRGKHNFHVTRAATGCLPVIAIVVRVRDVAQALGCRARVASAALFGRRVSRSGCSAPVIQAGGHVCAPAAGNLVAPRCACRLQQRTTRQNGRLAALARKSLAIIIVRVRALRGSERRALHIPLIVALLLL